MKKIKSTLKTLFREKAKVNYEEMQRVLERHSLYNELENNMKKYEKSY